MALLSSGRRDLPERQRTIRSALDWSHQLLSPIEQVFFRRLGAFAGSFPEEGAVICEGDVSLDVLEGLTSLVDKSLLVRDEGSGPPRFHMLETVREFAQERLAEAGEDRDTRLRHAAWVTQLLEDAYRTLDRTATRSGARQRLLQEEGNVRTAWSFLSSAEGDREQAWQMLCHLSWVRHFAFQVSEGRRAYDRLRAGGESADPVIAAAALGLAAWAQFATPTPATLQELERSVAVLEAQGERRFLPGIFTAYASVLAALDPPRAQPVLDRALALCVEGGQQSLEVWARLLGCLYLLTRGELERADRAADELVASSLLHDQGDGIAFGMTAKARLRLLHGDLPAAREAFASAAAYARSQGNTTYGRADALTGLASVALAQGDEVAAHAVIAELLRFSGGHNGATGTELMWGALAYLLAKAGDRERALRVLEVIPRGVENPPPALRMQLDPTGALAKATAEARSLLGDPEPLPPGQVDLEAVLRVALGSGAMPPPSVAPPIGSF
jgi:hypothetical protein